MIELSTNQKTYKSDAVEKSRVGISANAWLIKSKLLIEPNAYLKLQYRKIDILLAIIW